MCNLVEYEIVENIDGQFELRECEDIFHPIDELEVMFAEYMDMCDMYDNLNEDELINNLWDD